MRTSIIRPGLLVALHSTVTGGVQYRRTDLDASASQAAQGSGEVSRWETTRVIEDPAEHDRAIKARGKAIGEIRSICAATGFGLLCPENRESELDEAIRRARVIADEHNATANCTRVQIYALKGRIASTDEEAARAIGQEVTALLETMARGVEKLDVKAIREAATRAAEMGAMLGDEQIKAVSEAVEQARKAARTIVKRVEKGGEEAATVLQDIQRGAIERARFAFLDTEIPADAPVSDPSPAVNVQRFADLDTCAPVTPAESAV
jgi:hypothetical protein